MTASAITSVNSDATHAAHAVSYGATIALALVSTADVQTVLFSFLSDSTGGDTFPAIAVTGHGTATFAMPADLGGGVGRGYLLQTAVNAGLPTQSISTLIVGAVNYYGYVPLCPGETMERHPRLGWLGLLNERLFPALS